MTQETLGGAIIHYINAEKEEVIFLRDDATPEGQAAAVERIQSALQSNLLAFRTTTNRLVAIPVQSILKIEINPAPPEVPGSVIAPPTWLAKIADPGLYPSPGTVLPREVP